MRPRLRSRGYRVLEVLEVPAAQVASMRPRLRSRGYGRGPFRARGTLPCFNAAPASKPGVRRFGPAQEKDVKASMRPRLRSRGYLFPAGGPGELVPASMRPRLRSRG